MKFEKRWVAVIVALAVLAASGAYYFFSPSARLTRLAKTRVLEKLNDPDSAKFKEIFVAKDGRTVCGEINAKNGFGGYTGFRQFLVINTYVYVSSGDEAYLPTLWDVACKDAPPSPVHKR